MTSFVANSMGFRHYIYSLLQVVFEAVKIFYFSLLIAVPVKEKLQHFETLLILKNDIALVQQKNPNNLDILAFWLANTSRLLHDMKQYSGDRVSIKAPLGTF